MELTDKVKDFISSIDKKFADDECNLSYNKLEFIHLVQQVEVQFDIEINDAKLNEIVKIKDLTDEVVQILGKNGSK